MLREKAIEKSLKWRRPGTPIALRLREKHRTHSNKHTVYGVRHESFTGNFKNPENRHAQGSSKSQKYQLPFIAASNLIRWRFLRHVVFGVL